MGWRSVSEAEFRAYVERYALTPEIDHSTRPARLIFRDPRAKIGRKIAEEALQNARIAVNHAAAALAKPEGGRGRAKAQEARDKALEKLEKQALEHRDTMVQGPVVARCTAAWASYLGSELLNADGFDNFELADWLP